MSVGEPPPATPRLDLRRRKHETLAVPHGWSGEKSRTGTLYGAPQRWPKHPWHAHFLWTAVALTQNTDEV